MGTEFYEVSIPQAVSAVATPGKMFGIKLVKEFQYRKR